MTFEKFMRNFICTNILVVFFNFNFLPFPFSDISPVIARSCWTGLPIASDSVAVTIAHPALGPSCSKNVFFYFWHIMIVELDKNCLLQMQKLEEKVWLTFGVAPSGTWRWIELLCKNSFPGSASVSRKDFERKFYILENILIIKDVIRYWSIWIRLWLSLTLAYVNAICTLSFKTFPKFPVHRTIPPHSPELIILLSLLPAESVSSSSPSRKLLLLCCSWNKF